MNTLAKTVLAAAPLGAAAILLAVPGSPMPACLIVTVPPAAAGLESVAKFTSSQLLAGLVAADQTSRNAGAGAAACRTVGHTPAAGQAAGCRFGPRAGSPPPGRHTPPVRGEDRHSAAADYGRAGRATDPTAWSCI